ncbi:TetR/AcrR family transcriptional regulator [Marinomonas mediterranea]|jgi:Transcriptional regulator|uniref:Transcriptional regulator, TetR family n=1 Tax=Marinomonas mediterranea (strain ATCC 700492 / JCM 21426 / NBRC 103028 / MMB-1) TaxID=717774 RepID=F2K2X8_MARM1|nr:TetR/AcrR family transcriptional regulator [Marinomonas mediterranea]ADZ92367.1 transcriptional regulator, TetR family [Marinomonas mediterranea MMB-1]WCN10319.1 TetR family transcriptional regulator [Marinomonas mediterranea]WCN14364.1 TetR family transcriptional regulator [Marinomonas mediterranea]WCN18416.1 TetR family transcriptional regulator [Marinomonas mediterranea MMB-1]
MSKRQANREEIYSRILDAAEVEFGLKGFNGASLQHIAERAGIPKPNVVYYFQSKENLYRQVLNQIISNWNDLFDKATVDDDPAVVLESFIRTKLKQSFDNNRSSKIFAMEVIQGANHIGEYLKEDLRPWLQSRVAVLESWMQAGKIKQLDAVSLIFMIWATTQHYADFEAQISALTGKEGFSEDDIEKVGDTVTSIILSGCGLR